MTRPKFEGFDDRLKAIMDGKVDVPNFEELDPVKGIASWASAGGSFAHPDVKQAKLPSDGRMRGNWARYLLNRTQGGQYDGTGYVVMYYNKGHGRIGWFAICKHTKVSDPDANHPRGWHPGHCSKCGIDLTVDSGD